MDVVQAHALEPVDAQLVEVVGAGIVGDQRDAARRLAAERLDRAGGQGVVGAVEDGLDDDRAGDAERLHLRSPGGDVIVEGPALGRVFDTVVVQMPVGGTAENVDMAVAGPVGRAVDGIRGRGRRGGAGQRHGFSVTRAAGRGNRQP